VLVALLFTFPAAFSLVLLLVSAVSMLRVLYLSSRAVSAFFNFLSLSCRRFYLMVTSSELFLAQILSKSTAHDNIFDKLYVFFLVVGTAPDLSTPVL